MCLYPRLIKNRKYTDTKKNKGIIPKITDDRVKYVPVGCGECIECRKQKARSWQVRLLEDIKTNKNGIFVTLTFSDQEIAKLTEEVNNYMLHEGKIIKCKRNLTGYILDNEIATRAMRKFNERWRKHHKKAIRHWMVTELGHRGTENIHLHGIVWTDIPKLEAYKKIEKIWQYGHIWPREERDRRSTYVNEKTISYTIKYVSKKDIKHKTYKPIILTSAGIGKNYTETHNSTKNKYNGNKTNEAYKTSSGHKVALPIYWRNKIYNEEERERLWIQKLDKQERWVMGEKVDISTTNDQYNELLKHYREINKRLGFGTDERNYEREEYERHRREIMQKTRIAKGKNKIASGGV